MKTQLVSAAICLGMLLVAAAPAISHHSFGAEFDREQNFAYTGVVTKIEWLNPHVYFYVDVTDEETGSVTNWAMEMGSPNGLMRNGWTRNSLKIGDVVSVEGFKARDGSDKGNASTVLLASGRRMFAGQNQEN